MASTDKPTDQKADENKPAENRTAAADARPAERTSAQASVEDRIDPRLDNRRGDQRPPLEKFPAKPQQIDGPELGDPVDRDARQFGDEDDRPRKGQKSPGPHGLGDTADKV